MGKFYAGHRPAIDIDVKNVIITLNRICCVIYRSILRDWIKKGDIEVGTKGRKNVKKPKKQVAKKVEKKK